MTATNSASPRFEGGGSRQRRAGKGRARRAGFACLLVALAAVAAIAGCDEDIAEPADGMSVQVLPSDAVRAEPGDTVRLSASVLDAEGRPVPGAVVRWTSADTTVATVDASGLVAVVSAGSTTVTATVASGAAASVAVTAGFISKVGADGAVRGDGRAELEEERQLADRRAARRLARRRDRRERTGHEGLPGPQRPDGRAACGLRRATRGRRTNWLRSWSISPGRGNSTGRARPSSCRPSLSTGVPSRLRLRRPTTLA